MNTPPMAEFNQEVPLTIKSIQVLRYFLARRTGWYAGCDVITPSRMESGVLYPILKRFEGQGLLVSKWQEATVNDRRRYHVYQITEKGCRVAQKVIDDQRAEEEFYKDWAGGGRRAVD